MQSSIDGFENKDALLNETFKKKPKSLKAAQAEEHGGQDELFKVYTERAWPACDAIVGNPPFLGGKLLRRELGDTYVAALFENFGGRVRPEADLCCYWFEKARQQIEEGHCRRAGLLATQGIRGGANRDVIKRIKETGDIFFAESDREWILAGANVHVSMIGFDGGEDSARMLDGRSVQKIHANLSAHVTDITDAKPLAASLGVAFMGDSKGGKFDIAEDLAVEMLRAPNPHGRPNSDVIIPWANGLGMSRRGRPMFIIDFGMNATLEAIARYQAPFEYAERRIRPQRAKSRSTVENWWQHERARPAMMNALTPLPRFIATVRHSKHRLFFWMRAPALPDSALFVFASSDDEFFGLLQSRFHEAWARSQGTQVRERESGFRYTPTSCFETFPMPNPSTAQKEAIAGAAKELNALRENWLNPTEWTTARTLAFPGALDGPWRRFVRDANAQGIGTVHYPLTEPRDADCAAKLAKRTLTNLYNERPAWLANAHAKLDAAVAAAYGWPADLSEDEILARLLELNLARAAAEQATAQKPAAKSRASRAKTAEEML